MVEFSARAFKRIFTCKIWLRYSRQRGRTAQPGTGIRSGQLSGCEASGAPGDASRDRRVVQSGNQETDHKKYTKNMSGLRKRLQNAITKRPTPFAQHKFLEVVDEDTCYSDILLFFNTNFPMNAFPHECILYDGIPGFPLVNKKKRTYHL